MVTPKQLWLDGIAKSDGTVRQFVAMPLGKGYTVEAQITGEEFLGGLQIEVVPSKIKPSLLVKPPPPVPRPSPVPVGDKVPGQGTEYQIYVKRFTSKDIVLRVSPFDKICRVKEKVEEEEGVPPVQQRLLYKDKQLPDDRTIWDYRIGDHHVLSLVLALRGGGCPPEEMGIAAGGIIDQIVERDTHSPTLCESDCGTIFNVQILNSDAFQAVTGQAPPASPITAETYANHNFPYFKIWDEKPSGVSGEFDGIKSVNEKDIEGVPSPEKTQAVTEVSKSTHNRVVLLDHKGRRVDFRTVSQMERMVRKRFKDMAV